MNDFDVIKKIANELNIEISKRNYEVDKQNKIISLELSAGKIKSLPPEIVQLISLQRLDLSDNQFTRVPVEIFQLQNLHVLNLSWNQLTRAGAFLLIVIVKLINPWEVFE